MNGQEYSRRVLVVRLSALGDVAILQPVLKQRAGANPDVLFLMAGPPRLASLFRGVANVQYIPTEKRQKPRELYRQLSSLKPDVVADMHHVLRTIGVDWMFRLRGVQVHSIKKRGARGSATSRRYDRGVARCVLRGKVSEGEYWKVKGAARGVLTVGVAPFAQHKGKIWPLEKMEQLVSMLSERGYKVLLFGSADEAKVLEPWAGKYAGVESLAGRFGFEEELERIATLDVMVSMDSANMHFASCVGVPVVSIWGATHPCRGFYGWKQDPSWAVQREMDCRPCSKYGHKPCRKGDYPCLKGIEPIEVIDRIAEVLSGES